MIIEIELRSLVFEGVGVGARLVYIAMTLVSTKREI